MAITRNTFLSNVADLIFYLDAVNPKSYPGSGATWNDLSPNRNNFTLFNTPTYTSNGTTGTYLSFNGSNQYARSVNAINFNAYSAVTIEIGYRPEFIDYAYWSSLQNNISASGGGAGAASGASVGVNQAGYAGGSGGGSIRDATSATGNIGQFTPIEGYGGGASGTPAGYAFGTDWGAGGGGGSGGKGGNTQLGTAPFQAGRGGTGTLLSITGTPTYYAGGGGGGGSSYQTVSGGVGTVNTGGGGAGGTSANGGGGTANSGGGGGGGYSSFSGGAGGSGVVIAAYYSPTQVALGGVITTASGNKWIHTFTTNSRFTATNTTSIELLVVGGGGGGGSSSLVYHGGGGGGAGGLRYFNTLSITTAGYYSVTVGLGGSGGSGGNTGTNGQSSSFTPVITVPTITTTAQILYETTGTGDSTATGGITLLMNSNDISTVANTYRSQWQGYGPRLFGFTPSTNTSFNSVVETFVNGVDSTGRQVYINGTTAQFFTNTSMTVLTSATTAGLAFANTWTYVASRAGSSNFFRGDIAYVRAWGRKLATSDLGNNVSAIAARQSNSYQTPTITTVDPYVPTLITSGLQLWLDAGQTASYSGSGPTWTDLSGNGRTGTIVNSPAFTSAGASSYFSFGSGASQRTSFTYQTPVQSAATAFTWNIWAYPTANLDSYVLMGYRGTTPLQFYKLTTNKFEMYPAEVFNAFALNVWQNICAVYDGTQAGTANMKLYVNGVQVGLRDGDTPDLSPSAMPFYVGGDPIAGEYATARINQVAVYNRALTAGEVSTNFNTFKARFGL